MSDTIARNIRYYRKKKKLTQAQLAELTSVSLMSIRRYETIGTENREPNLSSLNDIAKALDVHVSDLLIDKIFLPVETPTSDKRREHKQEEKELAFLNTMDSLREKLNDKGQDKAIEQVEMLTKIPEYQKRPENVDIETADDVINDETP